MNIYVRRGGPNYQTGLAKMRTLGAELGVPIEVWSLYASSRYKCGTLHFLKRHTISWKGDHWDRLHTPHKRCPDYAQQMHCRSMDQRRPWLGSAKKPLIASWPRKSQMWLFHLKSHPFCTRRSLYVIALVKQRTIIVMSKLGLCNTVTQVIIKILVWCSATLLGWASEVNVQITMHFVIHQIAVLWYF